LLDTRLHRYTLAAQVTFYALALAGWLWRDRPRRMRVLTVPFVFCLLNWVTVVAFVRFVGGVQRVTWEKAP
jgi:hypothetical protein